MGRNAMKSASEVMVALRSLGGKGSGRYPKGSGKDTFGDNAYARADSIPAHSGDGSAAKDFAFALEKNYHPEDKHVIGFMKSIPAKDLHIIAKNPDSPEGDALSQKWETKMHESFTKAGFNSGEVMRGISLLDMIPPTRVELKGDVHYEKYAKGEK